MIVRALLILIWLTSTLSLAAPVTAADDSPDLYAQLEDIAGEDIEKASYYRLMFWKALDERTLILWLGREEPYLVNLREFCYNLTREDRVSLSNYIRPGRNVVRARWDYVLTREHRCRIVRLRPLDLGKMYAMGMDLASMRSRRREEEKSDAVTDR